MTATDIHVALPRVVRITTAMHRVIAAGSGLAAAKTPRSVELIACAHTELQSAVDAAQDLDIEWGQIGLALAIARGNAYQRYRRKPSLSALPVTIGGRDYPLAPPSL